MKSYMTAAVVLILLLVAAPWGIGKLAEQRVNSGLDELVKTAPYLSIVERKWQRGWFTSEQEVTFEVLGPWLRALSPKTVTEVAGNAPAPGESQPEEPAETPVDEVAGAGSPDTTGGEPPSVEPPAAAIGPIRFTVRNHILHGPVLWFSALGIARVDSQLVLPETVRAELTKLFGEESPLQISTRVRFFGGGTTTISGGARELEFAGQRASVSYDAFKVKLGYSAHFDDLDLDGDWPRFEINNVEDDDARQASYRFEGMSATGTSHRVRGDLYDGDFKLAVDDTHFVGPDKGVVEVAGLHYIVDTTIDDDFMDVAVKFGTGAARSKVFDELGLKVEEIHYDFTVRRLHLDTLVKMVAAMKASYARPVATAADVDAAISQPMKEYGLELLKHDPEFVIDRFGGSSSEGDMYLKGIIKLKGVTGEDLAVGAMGLIGKLDADITFTMAQQLAAKVPNGAAGLATAMDQGYARLEGKNVVSHIEFRKGALKINGKEQGIPGLGAPNGGLPPGTSPQPE